MKNKHTSAYDLAVIGSGFAGMAASLFAANRGLTTLQVGNVGGIIFSSGLLDLLGVHPVSEGKVWDDPWGAIEALIKANPKTPYAKIQRGDIEQSFTEFTSFLEEAGMPYQCGKDKNLHVITGMGTVKTTYCVPESMFPGVAALEKKAPCLLVDFNGLKEYGAMQIAETLKPVWPALRTAPMTFPGTEKRNEVYALHLAQALEIAETRVKLAALIAPKLGDAQYVAFPAVLGIKRTKEICSHLSELLHVPVFEIPTLPASVPGLRIKEALDAFLPRKGVHRLNQKRVRTVTPSGDGAFTIGLDDPDQEEHLSTGSIILATGRFMGNGLIGDRGHIKESIFDLPVTQPDARALWHSDDFFNPAGHPINSAGLEVDSMFRPTRDGKPVFENLYAAGSILAHQDWMRMKAGAGIAIASAYAAVNAAIRTIAKN